MPGPSLADTSPFAELPDLIVPCKRHPCHHIDPAREQLDNVGKFFLWYWLYSLETVL